MFALVAHSFIFNDAIKLSSGIVKCHLRNSFMSNYFTYVKFFTNFIECRANKTKFFSFAGHFNNIFNHFINLN